MKFATKKSFNDLFGLYQSYLKICGFSCFKFPSKCPANSPFGVLCTLVNSLTFAFFCCKSIHLVVNKVYVSSSKVFLVGINILECQSSFNILLCLVVNFINRKYFHEIARNFIKFNKLVSQWQTFHISSQKLILFQAKCLKAQNYERQVKVLMLNWLLKALYGSYFVCRDYQPIRMILRWYLISIYNAAYEQYLFSSLLVLQNLKQISSHLRNVRFFEEKRTFEILRKANEMMFVLDNIVKLINRSMSVQIVFLTVQYLFIGIFGIFGTLGVYIDTKHGDEFRATSKWYKYFMLVVQLMLMIACTTGALIRREVRKISKGKLSNIDTRALIVQLQAEAIVVLYKKLSSFYIRNEKDCRSLECFKFTNLSCGVFSVDISLLKAVRK